MDEINISVPGLTMSLMPFTRYNQHLFEIGLLPFISIINGAKGQHQKENCALQHSKLLFVTT